MADPTTSNILLAVPTRGSDSGTWDLPVNGNSNAIDGLFGGQATLTLANQTTVLLTSSATGSVSPSAGPNQSWNACLKLVGSLSGGNSTIQLTQPHRYIVDAIGLAASTWAVALAPSTGTGTQCGVPWGEVSEFWFDGTNVNYVGLARVGSYLDIAIATTPAWIGISTKLPYLLCDGTVYSTSVYPTLGAMLGSTFGGNGITTFAVPDLLNRVRVPLFTAGGSPRLTNANSGIAGQIFGLAGGDERMQQHNHATTEIPHNHGLPTQGVNNLILGPGNNIEFFGGGPPAGNVTNGTTTGLTINNAGSGTAGNVQPTSVCELTFIRAG